MEYFLFDVDRFTRELGLAHHATLERVERMQESHGERRTRSEAAACGEIRVVVDFEPALDAEIANNLTR